MNAPEDQNGLREALARALDKHAFGHGHRNYYGPDLDLACYSARQRVALKTADELIAGPIASLVADRDRMAVRRMQWADLAEEAAKDANEQAASLRAAEAEITRLKEGMEAAVGAATALVESERVEAEAGAACEAAHAAVLDAVNASVGAEDLRKLLHANREAATARSATLAPRQRAQEAAFSFLRSLATLSPKEQP